MATRTARRHGLALPVPLTVRFPPGTEANEAEWQELVVRHLDLPDWECLDAGDDADVLGPNAQQVLRRHGVIWSPVLATRVRSMVPAAGGWLLTGEGGDEVLGARRATSLATLARARRPLAAARLAKPALADLLPRSQRAVRWRHHLDRSLGLEWLQPEVREEFLARSGALWADEPLNWCRALEWVTSCRHVSLGMANMTSIAAEVGAALRAPFLDTGFLGALGEAFGTLGPPGRTAAVRALFASVLPGELLARRTKAVFTLPAWGRRTREFVGNWTGQGLSTDLVDVDALRRHWEGPRPSAMTFGLVQAAWLAQQGPVG